MRPRRWRSRVVRRLTRGAVWGSTPPLRSARCERRRDHRPGLSQRALRTRRVIDAESCDVATATASLRDDFPTTTCLRTIPSDSLQAMQLPRRATTPGKSSHHRYIGVLVRSSPTGRRVMGVVASSRAHHSVFS